VRELHPWLFALEIPDLVRARLLKALSDLESNLAVGTSARLQLAGFVGAFAVARADIVGAVKVDPMLT